MRGARRFRRRGFSLIEVLGATTMVTVGLMAAFYMVGLGTAVNADARNSAQAYLAAQQEIEILRNISFQPTNTSTGLRAISSSTEIRFLQPDGSPDASFPGDQNMANGRSYPGLVPALQNLPNGKGTLIIADDSNATIGNSVKHISVIVHWTERNNEQRSIVMGTIIAQGGIDPR